MDDLPKHEVSGRHYLKGCLFIALALVALGGALIALFTYLAFHNPQPS